MCRGLTRRRVPNSRDVPLLAPRRRNRSWVLAVGGLLLLAVALVFGQTVGHEFVNLDDGEYVSENPHLSQGLGAQGIAWTFTHSF